MIYSTTIFNLMYEDAQLQIHLKLLFFLADNIISNLNLFFLDTAPKCSFKLYINFYNMYSKSSVIF